MKAVTKMLFFVAVFSCVLMLNMRENTLKFTRIYATLQLGSYLGGLIDVSENHGIFRSVEGKRTP